MTNGEQNEKRDEERRRADQRMREEMGRQRRAEEVQLKALKVGCIGVIVAIALGMVLLFLIG